MNSISVVIPTYNRAHLAARAAESALSQVPPPAEVIVVDDGSGDDTPQRLGGMPGVRYLRQDNAGLSAARNAGIRAATSEWIALLDDDDRFLPGKLAQDLAIIEGDSAVDLVYGNGRRVSPEGADLGLSLRNHSLPADPLRALLVDNFVLVQTVTVRRRLLLEVGLFDTALRVSEDIDMWVRLALHGARFRFAPEPLTEILRLPGSLSADPTAILEASLTLGPRHADALRKALGNPAREWWQAGPHYRLGRHRYEQGDLAGARRHLEAALEADPEHRGARLYLALTALGPLGRGPITLARGIKRLIWRGFGRAGWVEGRW
jgi:glycosyltransferase involved in cell wall biosynthesis